MIDVIRCEACGQALLGHWQCVVCRCFGHGNVKSRRDWAMCRDCVTALEKRAVRRCTDCGGVFPLAAFVKSNRHCPACRSKRYAERYRRSRDADRARARAWAEQNRERYLTTKRAYYAKHRLRLSAERRADYARRPDYYRAIARASRERHGPRWRKWRETTAYRRARYARMKLAVLRGER